AYQQVVHATGDAVLASSIRRAIRERPSERFANAGAFLAALDATEVPAAPSPARVQLRRAARWPLAVAAVVLVAGGGLIYAKRGHGTTAAPHRTVALLPFVDTTHNP